MPWSSRPKKKKINVFCINWVSDLSLVELDRDTMFTLKNVNVLLTVRFYVKHPKNQV